MKTNPPSANGTAFLTGGQAYQVFRCLGEGSFGQVFLAEHPAQPSLNRAIKVLRRSEPGMSTEVYDDFRRRFQQEAALGAHPKIKKNPHLLEVYSFEDTPERMLMWMDYAPGGSLQSRLDRLRQEGGSLPVEECRRIAAGIAEGLAALHDPAVDVVHRDLHPGNILFDQEENGNALVADLGLAQIPGGQSMRYHSGALQPHPGHPCYRSPEHENPNRALTPASDVYALGLILFEMLTGQRYNNHEGRRPRSLRKDVPLWLDALTARMLSKEPARRPRDGAEAARLLKRGGWRIPKWVPVIAALALAGGLLSQVDWASVQWPVLLSAKPVMLENTPYVIPTAAVTQTPVKKSPATPTSMPKTQISGEKANTSREVITAGNASRIVVLSEKEMESYLSELDWSSDGSALAIGGTDYYSQFSGGYALDNNRGQVILLDTSLQTIWNVQFNDNIEYLKISPDNKFITANHDNLSVILDAGSGKTITQLGPYSNSPDYQLIKSAAFSPEGDFLGLSLEDGRALIFSTGDWSLQNTLAASNSNAQNIAFSPRAGSKLFATIGMQYTRLWQLPGKMVASYGVDQGYVFGNHKIVRFTRDGSILAVYGGYDPHPSLIELWDVSRVTKDGFVETSLAGKVDDSIDNLSFSPDGKLMATISNGSIKLRAMPDGREISSIQVQNNPSSNLQFSPDGKSLAVVSGKTVLLLGIP